MRKSTTLPEQQSLLPSAGLLVHQPETLVLPAARFRVLTRDELPTWIEELRGRLERGELAGLPPVQLQPWYALADVEVAARFLQADVEIWRATPLEERLGDAPRVQQRMVAEDLSLLYERLVEGKPCPPINYQMQR
jgi:hypothetical protein